MTASDAQRQKAAEFKALHEGPAVLVLANAWDAGSARIFEASGAQAIGTSSAGIAASQGYPDGERIGRDEMIAVVKRIVETVAVPVSVDIEAGFGADPDAVLETVRAVIAAGAVGINIEDADPVSGDLKDVDDQIALIAAIRELADAHTLDLFINARTDVFWLKVGEPGKRAEHAVWRANAYRVAGASGLFVPGVTDPEVLRMLAKEIEGPLNVLAGPGCPEVAKLGELGVSRVSVGSGPMRATLALTRRIAEELLREGRYDSITRETIPYAEVNRLFEPRQQ